MVVTARPWAVLVVAFGVVQDLLVGPARGSLRPGGQPVHTCRLAGGGHLGKALGQVGRAGDEVPSGWQRHCCIGCDRARAARLA